MRPPLDKEARGAAFRAWREEFIQRLYRGAESEHVTSPFGSRPVVQTMGSGDGEWVLLPPPSARLGHSAIYDPVRDRMIVFGGSDGSPRNEVWALSLSGSPEWTRLTPVGTSPSGRVWHTAIYDPLRDRMVVFGGLAVGGPRNDVWSLSLSESPAWTELTPVGNPPPESISDGIRRGRSGPAAIYDPVRDRMIVFAGGDNDVWSLSLSESPEWARITPAGPAPYGGAAIYDPVRDRMVVFTGSGEACDDGITGVWALSLSGAPAWTALCTESEPPWDSRPWNRANPTAIYDPVRDRMVIYGGYDNEPFYDVWALSLSGSPQWTLLRWTTPPMERFFHAMIYDPVRDRMVVFGGFHDYLGLIGDVWGFSLSGSSAWTKLADAPSAHFADRAIYDPVRDRMMVFGEFGYRDYLDPEVWALSLSESRGWTNLTTTGTAPSSWEGHTAIYDPVRDRMVISVRGDASLDVWTLSLSGDPTWTELAPGGTPPGARIGQSAIYDPVRDRMVVFGGEGLNDVWALSLSGSPAWTDLAPAGSPPSTRSGHTAIYDPVRDRMVVFGGSYWDESYHVLNDVWALSLSGSPQWEELAPAGTPPSARFGQSAIYDPVRDRMVLFAGRDDDEWPQRLRNDLWALSLSGSPAWTVLATAGTPPSVRSNHMAIYDPVRDRMVVFAGNDESYLPPNDLWALQWSTLPVPVAFDLTPHTLNLASHGLWLTGYLEPASPYAASAIDMASIRLNGTVPLDPAAPTALGDHDGNGVPDRMVKFNRAAVELTVSEGDNVPVTVTGMITGHPFSGTDYIRVRRAVVSAPVAGSHLTAGSVTQVRWEAVSQDTVESVALLGSVDGGSTWSLIAQRQPNTGSYDWVVPNLPTEHAKVAVVLVESADSTGQNVDGVVGVSEAFTIESVVGVGDLGQARLSMRGATPNPASGGQLRVEFTLRDGGSAKLELMDVAGRVLNLKQVGTLGPGTHSLDLSIGGALRSGIYFLRLTQGGSEVRGRIAVIR